MCVSAPPRLCGEFGLSRCCVMEFIGLESSKLLLDTLDRRGAETQSSRCGTLNLESKRSK